MGYIQNLKELATTSERKVILELVETAYDSIKSENIIGGKFKVSENLLNIAGEKVELEKFERIFLLGFGKGSAHISRLVEELLGNKLTEGYVIDVTLENFEKIEFTLGTHPLPSEQNFNFTKKVLTNLDNLKNTDLVLVITCGGGSAMLFQPWRLSIEEMIQVNKGLLTSGADIHEMNIVRKHLSKVKGGGLAKELYPATVYNLIFSDVPGNDLDTIASGPSVIDRSNIDDAWSVVEKYGLNRKISITKEKFIETPKKNKLFEKEHYILMLSNKIVLEAMEKKAKSLGKNVKIYSDTFQGEARFSGRKLIAETDKATILLAGGETTVKVIGKGQGGRNMEVVLGALEGIGEHTTICSIATDGWDNVEVAGAIADRSTLDKAKAKDLDTREYLDNNDSLSFFKATGDAILTGRLPTNVSDLMIVYRK